MTLKRCKDCSTEVSHKAFACPKCGAADPSGAGIRFLKIFFMTIIIIITILITLVSISWATPPESIEVIAAKHEIQSESKVRDLFYDPESSVQWHIGVLDNKTQRHGYASYICGILEEHKLVTPNTFVRVVDVQKIIQGQNFRDSSLGKVNCATYEHSYP